MRAAVKTVVAVTLVAAVVFVAGQALLKRSPIDGAAWQVPPESLRDRFPDALDYLIRPGLVLAFVTQDSVYHVFVEGIQGHGCPFGSERDPEACFSTALHTTWRGEGVYRINGSDLLKLPTVPDGAEVLWRGIPGTGSIGVRSPGACDRIERFDGYECVDGGLVYMPRDDADDLTGVARRARKFGFGRLPVGDVRLCPNGEFDPFGLVRSDIRDEVESIVRAANASKPDPTALWRSMDRAFQDVFGSRDELSSAMRKHSVPRVYRSWGISGQVVGPKQRIPLLDIQAFCGKEVAEVTWMGSAYFPRFDGTSGGAVQMFFIARPDGPRLWFTY